MVFRAVGIGIGVVLAVVVAVVAILTAVGNHRWRTETDRLHQQQNSTSRADWDTCYQLEQLTGLPDPVQRYLETVLVPGQPMVAAARITHTGTFNMGSTGEQWLPFRSTQHVVTGGPSFVWDGRIRMVPGVYAHVHDAYVGGEGILYAAIAGLITVAEVRGTPEIARGELMRFLAETAWYPTVLLPGQGITWTAVDTTSADATITDGETSVTMRFFFNADNLIESVYAADRDRTVGSTTEPTPWDGRFSDYQVHDGMLVPMDGDVGWVLPEGRLSYWRGRITDISYQFACDR